MPLNVGGWEICERSPVMEDDEEVPQLTTLDEHLADAFGKLQRPNQDGGDVQETASTKVPITILTGMIPLKTELMARIPRSREDDAIKLHPQRTAWQKDSRNPKWYLESWKNNH
jgi:hypothetical protein